MPKDYYAILGVCRAADAATIHSAFRTLARQYHPDAGRGSSTSKFGEALEAYHTLSDPARRRQHDIDLGKSAERPKVNAEPLFDTARSQNNFAGLIHSDIDKLMKDLLCSLESDFGVTFFPRTFF